MKICLIGSSRFRDEYYRVNKRLTLAGHIVYTIAMVSSSERGRDGPNISADEKETLDLVHLRKIQESDAVVLITNEQGYIGESTKREIKWAQMNAKDILLADDIRSGVRDISEWIKARSSTDPLAISGYYAKVKEIG